MIKITENHSLAIFSKAALMLAEADTIQKAQELKNLALTASDFVKRKGLGEEAIKYCRSYALEAERRIGELLKQTDRATGAKGIGPIAVTQSNHNAQPTLAELGLTKRESAEAQMLAALPVEKFEEIKSGKTTKTKVKKQQQIEEAKAETTKQTKEQTRQAPPVVYLESCFDFLRRFEKQSVDLLLTDPPYMTDVASIDDFAQSWLPPYLEMIKPTGRGYIFIGSYPKELRAYLNIKTPPHITLEQVLVWTYKNTLGQNPKNKYKQNWQAILYFVGIEAAPLNCPLTTEQWAVQEINAPDGRRGDRYHEWQKPIDISDRFIRHSTQPGDIVIDPFTCTGTFLLSASKLGRQAFGCDISEDNIIKAEERGCTIQLIKTLKTA